MKKETKKNANHPNVHFISEDRFAKHSFQRDREPPLVSDRNQESDTVRSKNSERAESVGTFATPEHTMEMPDGSRGRVVKWRVVTAVDTIYNLYHSV